MYTISSQLFNFHDSFVLNIANFQGIKLPSSFSNSRKPVEIIDDFDTDLEDNPEVIKVFSKAAGPLSLEFIKGCVLGSAKTIINKCLKAFGEDFPKIEKYTISNYWQREFKYELHILLANIADQSHLTYLALQNVFDGMKELAAEEIPEAVKEKKALVSALKKNKTNIPKQLKTIKRGVYQVFDSIARSHINSRLWLKARMLFLQYMFNQLNDIGKAKGHDDTIIKDFTDLKYYCEKSINESNEFFDFETKSFFMLIEISLELFRGASLKVCLNKLNNCILNLVSTNNQLSHQGFITYLKASILKSDIEFATNLLECQDAGSCDKNKLSSSIDGNMNSLLDLQHTILSNLSKNSGEKIECFTDKSKSYFDSIYKEIKNLYNPFLHYLVHTKVRLGSCLMLKSSYHDNQLANEGLASNKLWHHALNVLGSAIEINKVISERSINLEIELNYKYSHCIRELFITRQVGTLSDIVDSYGHTINLLNNSTHDLHLIKQCYLELAVGFISTFDSSVIMDSPCAKAARETSLSILTSSSNTPSSSAKPASRSRKTAVQSSRAVEAALTALALAIRTSNAIKQKMLLSGNESIKNMASIQTSDCPIFVPNDLIAYHVFAERKRIYRDEIEEEVLSLAPEFDLKQEYKSYDDKVELLADQSDKCITWIHVLNYQTKLQSIGSMRNLNTLRNGKNRYKYSELYTIGLTPVLKSCHLMASRLFELNSYLRDNLDIYRTKCQAHEPITDFFRIFARKSTAQTNARASANLNTLLQYVKVYNANLSNNMSVVNYPAINDVESVRESLMSSQSNKANTAANDWSYLQTWPANFNFSSQSTLKINESSSYDSFADYMMTMSWQKNLAVIDEDVYGNGDDLLCIIAVRDQLTSNKIKFRYISAGEVLEIHEKLVPLSAIADTAFNNESDMKIESNSQFM
ncbi:cilia- and flagella-associated 54, partial [Brachionus plicatilis]